MRYSQLLPGQVFHYQGRDYIKHDGLIALARDGGQRRVIPRSARVEVSGPPAAADDDRGPVAMTPECLAAALDRLDRAARSALAAGAAGDAGAERLWHQALIQVRQDLGLT